MRTLLALLALLPDRPIELYDRTAGLADLALERLSGPPPAREAVTWEEAVRSLHPLPEKAGEVLREPALNEVERDTRRLLTNIRDEDAFSPRWAADSLFARLCYLACRLTRPAAVVETGVAYGVSAAYILRALEENGGGVLHSVDLPPLTRDHERFWGIAVPGASRDRWRLHRGASRRVLPGLLAGLAPLDLFVHDSLHTRRNMAREFEDAWPHLRPGGMILADDVERNDAFYGLRRRDPGLWRIVRDRERNPLHGGRAPVVFGVAVK